MLKVLITVLLLTGSSGVFSKGECKAEMKEKCSQYKGDREAMKACINEQISEDCREKVKKRRKKRRKARREANS